MPKNTQDHLLDTIEHYFGIANTDAEELLAELQSLDIAGGKWLFQQGEPANALYFLVRGRLQVWIRPDDGSDDHEAELVGEIAPGESVGEIGLLTGGVRTAGIRAIRDSQLLKLDRKTFEQFAIQHPNLVLQLAGGVAQRLTDRTRSNASPSRKLSTIALLPLDERPWVDEFCRKLVAELQNRARTLRLTSQDLGKLGAPIGCLGADEAVPDSLRNWLATMENDHSLLIYVADSGDTAWSRLCLRQADTVLLLADAGDDPGERDWEAQLLSNGAATTAHRALLLRHPSDNAAITGTDRWLAERDVDYHLHVRAGHKDEISRLVRILMGEAVGLVLGGGAARGFAEVGVYRAMCEAGVPIDWIGGTSIGGIIGAAIARDEGPDYAEEASREAFVRGKPFGDFTLPVLSLIRGKRMERLTQQHLPGEIEDLPTPFFCVSTLLDCGELRIHERGSIWRALRATAALPGMLPPAVIERRLAVDGAVVNNLPVDIMRQKPVGRVVAVDVSSRRTFTVDYDELPSPWRVIGGKFMPGKRKHRVPGVISVLMKSAEIGTATKMRELAASADLLLRPPVDKFGLTDIKSFDRIVNVGYEHAKEQLAKWTSAEERAIPREPISG